MVLDYLTYDFQSPLNLTYLHYTLLFYVAEKPSHAIERFHYRTNRDTGQREVDIRNSISNLKVSWMSPSTSTGQLQRNNNEDVQGM